MRCRAVLSSCSCSPRARLHERPKNYPPALLLSSPAFPFAFPSTPFPASSPSLPPSLAHSKQMSRYDSRCELEATTTAYDILPTVTTVSTFARCHVKSSRLALKTPCMCPVSACIQMSEARVRIYVAIKLPCDMSSRRTREK